MSCILNFFMIMCCCWWGKLKYLILNTLRTQTFKGSNLIWYNVNWCEVKNNFELTGPPDITSDSTQFAKPGDRALIQCMSISSPKPSFVWSRNGLSIDYASSGRFSAPEEDLPYGRKSTLQIMNTQEEDFGIYNCTVTNIKGTDTLMITLQKTGEI